MHQLFEEQRECALEMVVIRVTDTMKVVSPAFQLQCACAPALSGSGAVFRPSGVVARSEWTIWGHSAHVALIPLKAAILRMRYRFSLERMVSLAASTLMDLMRAATQYPQARTHGVLLS